MASNPLPYVVDCKWPTSGWEPIAAFNVESVARWYAKQCEKTNPQLGYRVRDAEGMRT